MITSKDNKLIKYLISIKDKKQSRTDLVCLIETIKIVRQMLDKNMVTHIFCVEEKIGYICISKPETAQNANDCVWDVYYGGENEWLDVVAYEPLN